MSNILAWGAGYFYQMFAQNAKNPSYKDGEFSR